MYNILLDVFWSVSGKMWQFGNHHFPWRLILFVKQIIKYNNIFSEFLIHVRAHDLFDLRISGFVHNLSEKIFGRPNFSADKIFGRPNFSADKIFGRPNFSADKIFGRLNFSAEKKSVLTRNFGSFVRRCLIRSLFQHEFDIIFMVQGIFLISADKTYRRKKI